ncbi:uncharacterized protein BDW43DRAFT_296468 [Aspergillus alliaceus]|uniref:uncharacterized protein n=1 Tax=Petromyces alliaceus TaxID=209559 RepID=UPI0012A4F8BC|nr:uncharacterized protein BDW43DRAFT_296468 [Aspergillus alliaceus]KAB8239136.1 hypothetical protein BDW43DRAFT_296468 [Aspergillus alliaceus]
MTIQIKLSVWIKEKWRKAIQLEKKIKARRELRQQRGYDANDHRQKDSERTRGRSSLKSKESYRERVRKHEEFLTEKNMSKGYKFGEGYPAPTLKEPKEFIRWLIEFTEGRLAFNGRPTMLTIKVRAQEFILGFFLKTGNGIPSHDATDLYYWIKNELVEEEVLSAATDDPFFMSGRYRVQFHFITLQFLCTGARVSSFTPASVDKVGQGLHYKVRLMK